MGRTEAQRAAQQRYNSKAYDLVNFRVKKGMKEEYKKAAQDRGLGLMELVRNSVDEYIINHPIETTDDQNKNSSYDGDNN